MPLNARGKRILASMKRQYGAKRGKSIFYASERTGKIRGVKKTKRKRK